MYISKVVILALLFNLIEYLWSGTTTATQFVFSCMCIVPLGLRYKQFSQNMGCIPAYLMFPFVIWMLEILIHSMCLRFYGCNPAWHYTGEYSMFHGAITLNYYLPWVGVGIIFDYASHFVDYHLHHTQYGV